MIADFRKISEKNTPKRKDLIEKQRNNIIYKLALEKVPTFDIRPLRKEAQTIPGQECISRQQNKPNTPTGTVPVQIWIHSESITDHLPIYIVMSAE